MESHPKLGNVALPLQEQTREPLVVDRVSCGAADDGMDGTTRGGNESRPDPNQSDAAAPYESALSRRCPPQQGQTTPLVVDRVAIAGATDDGDGGHEDSRESSPVPPEQGDG